MSCAWHVYVMYVTYLCCLLSLLCSMYLSKRLCVIMSVCRINIDIYNMYDPGSYLKHRHGISVMQLSNCSIRLVGHKVYHNIPI